MLNADLDNSMYRSAVGNLLGRVALLSSVRQMVSATCPPLTAAITAFAGAMLIDAKFPMGPMPRLTFALILTGALTWTMAQLMGAILPPRGVNRRRRLSSAARLTERRLGIRDSTLINAVQLTESTCPLQQAAIIRLQLRALESISGVRARSVVSWRAAGAASATLVGVIVLGAAAAAAFPRLAKQEWPRFAMPFHDHPAFTWTDFDITVAPAEVTLGEAARVRVETRGELPNSLRLEVVDERGGPVGMVEMAAGAGDASDGVRSFTAELRSLRAPVLISASGETGRSQRVRIEPVPRPRLLAASARAMAGSQDSGPPEPLIINAEGSANQFAVPAGAVVEVRLDCSLPPSRLETQGAADVEVSREGTVAIARVRVSAGAPEQLTLRAVSAEGLSSRESVVLTLHPIDADAIGAGAEQPLGARMLALKDNAQSIGGMAPMSSAEQTSAAARRTAEATGAGSRAGDPHGEDSPASTESAGAGAAGRGGDGSRVAGADRAVPRQDSAAELTGDEGALVARGVPGSSTSRAGVGNAAPDNPPGGGIDRVPDAYRGLVSRYYSIIAARGRQTRTREERPGAQDE